MKLCIECARIAADEGKLIFKGIIDGVLSEPKVEIIQIKDCKHKGGLK
jgi:hypothetical protein